MKSIYLGQFLVQLAPPTNCSKSARTIIVYGPATSLTCIFPLQLSISCLQELMAYITSEEFKEVYGEAYLIPKRLNQDIVESFFSLQRQLCGGNRNMTAYSYAYNVNGILSFQSSNLVTRSAYNIEAMEDTVKSQHLPKKSRHSAKDSVYWTANL